MSSNDLLKSTSPYLLQHADNPVHWKVWGDAAFTEAKEQNKPILLSIGYAACHWCHVMAHESFEDQATANVMNDLFVNIKVDREEHPDVDAIYQKALSLTGQHGGWPLTMFLLPTGEPFWGGTYFPNRPAFGRPAFTDILKNVSQNYQSGADHIQQNVDALSNALAEETQPKGNGLMQVDDILHTTGFIHQNIDQVHGGLRGAPKFPQPVLLDFLWRAAWIKQDEELQKMVILSLEKMCLGGIYDHLGGGFARYSTDEEWLAPHFEKMLYDNGLLISLLAKVWRYTRSPLFKRTISESIGWVFMDMKVQMGDGFAFASALDADTEGEEGKFYVWDESEVDEILGKASRGFKMAYDITDHGNWEHKNILRRITNFISPEGEAHLNHCRQQLYEERKKRIAPGRDDKVLTDWNAMMIKALCEAGSVFDQPKWVETARIVFATLLSNMEIDGQLYHSWCQGRLGTKAYLEDYANLSLAALALYETTGDNAYLKHAIVWVDHVNTAFGDTDLGGYKFAANQTVEGLALKPKPIADNATPSGNGLMAHLLCDLYHLTGNTDYQQRFETLIKTFGHNDSNEIFTMPGLCGALLRYQKLKTIAVIGDLESDGFKQLKLKAFSSISPDVKILLGDGQAALSPLHPLAGKSTIDGEATVYVCELGTCSPPLTDLESFTHLLENQMI